jgi:hypothetical protein
MISIILRNINIFYRIYLAALHFNENVTRPQRTTKEGEKQFSVSFPKGRGGEGVAKEVKVEQTFSKCSHAGVL